MNIRAVWLTEKVWSIRVFFLATTLAPSVHKRTGSLGYSHDAASPIKLCKLSAKESKKYGWK